MADDAAIAAKYGGTPVDHASIAAKYGGKPVQNIHLNLNPSLGQPAPTATPSGPAPDTRGFFGTLGGDIANIARPFNPLYKPEVNPKTGIPVGEKPVDPTQAAQVALSQRQVAGQSFPRALTEGVAESAFGGNMQGFDEAMKSGNYQQALAHAIIPAAQAGLMFKTGEAGTATDMPKAGPSTAELKSGVADASYKRGLGVAEHLKSASKNIDNAVGESAQSFVSKVDKKFPEGAIDPKPIMEGVNALKADIVKTPTKYPPELAQMLEPEAKKTTGPRIMGGHLDLSDPQQLASYQKMKASGAFTPEEIARMEGPTSDMWTAEEAKQWRTKISAAIGKTQGPMKAVLTDARDNLTQQMRKAADDSGALADFQQYNNLHRKHMRFLEDPIIQKIMGGDTSKETLAPLSDPEKMAHVENMLGDWDKFGIKTEDLAKEGSDYGKAQAIMQKRGFRWWPWGTIGGMAGGHLLGIGYPAGAVLGLGAEKLFSPAGKAARLIESAKTSPFYQAGESRAADIARGWSEGVPEISAKKVALKKAQGK